ncbi:MAG: YopX family protein [Streptococcus sp.]|uniref:YopX family protein n=1 Tax=Streptococcus sp. TaxID=1306 RepID=UPI00258FF575|nr:YopX family protein [Streptococcus sp.]MCR5493055.1 YopX family protein [Streptococcus sp.]
MRVPKFRAWDRIKKRMFLVLEIDYENKLVSDETYWATTPFDDVKLMQFTGLKDKNGKEIYEGDIVRYECCSEGYVEEVIYDDKHCNFGTVDKDGETFSFDALISDFYVNCFEVIGNIWENKELLGEEE